MDEETSLPYFRYSWELLVSCNFVPLNSRENGRLTGFSRSYITDSDLQRKSEIDPLNLDKVVDELTLESNDTEMAIQQEAPEPEISGSPEIPTSFSSSKDQRNGTSYKKRKFGNKNAFKLNKLTFEEYWQVCELFIIYKTWLMDNASVMEQQYQDDLKLKIEEVKPSEEEFSLIDDHVDLENNEAYQNVVKNDPSYPTMTTYEEIFALHCKVIKEVAKRDFIAFQAKCAANRCKSFLNKVGDMGFCSTPAPYTSKVAPTSKEDKVEEKVTDSSPIPSKKPFPQRSLVVYDENEVFGDVLYNIMDPSTSKNYRFKGVKVLHEDETMEEEKEQQTESTTTEVVDRKNIRFAYDPSTDEYLLASGAREYYAHDPEIRKYFFQRYRLFTRLDQGVLMDREGWFSVTPERIAEHIADRVVIRPGMVVVDAFAGVGGNSIQFALKGARVIAIDLDPVRLKCAIENAKVYGVEDKIEFICSDFFHFAAKWTEEKGENNKEQIDAVFLSPPWGGPSYLKKKVFDLGDNLTPNGFDIFTASRAMSPNIAYFLPRNTCVKQLVSLCSSGGKCEIEQSCLNKKIKTITAYYGELAVSEAS